MAIEFEPPRSFTGWLVLLAMTPIITISLVKDAVVGWRSKRKAKKEARDENESN